MKKLLLTPIFLLIIPLVLASDFNSPSTRFSMVVTYSENVIVESASILDLANTLVTDMTVTEIIPGRKYEYETINSVPRGDYIFLFTFRNADAGSGSSVFSETRSITVTPATIENDFEITLESPGLGFSTFPPPFTLEFSTEESANCKYSLNAHNPVFQTNFDMDTTFGTTHRKSYEWPETMLDFYVFCQSTSYSGRTAVQHFIVGYVVGSNNFVSVVQDPEFVRDPVERRGKLIVQTTQDSLCYVEEQNNIFPPTIDYVSNLSNPSAYNKTNSFNLCFQDLCTDGLILTGSGFITDTEPHSFPISVVCRNLGQDEIRINADAKMQLTYDPNLQFLSPKNYVNKTAFDIKIRSDLDLISCDYDLEGSTGTLDEENKIYSKTISLNTQGPHSVEVSCSSYTGTVTRTKDFIIDTVPPVSFSVSLERNVCEGSNLLLNWSADDETSGIKELRYELLEGNQIKNTGNLVSSGSINYNFHSGEEYSLNAWVVDKALNPTNKEILTFTVLNSSSISCDYEAPRVRIYQVPTDFGTNYWLSCRDDSECENTFEYDIIPGSNTNTECTYNSTGDFETNNTLSTTSVICYKVKDKAGNERTGKEVITVDSNLDFCSNGIKDGDESDVDCGGSCQRCVLDKDCTLAGDCKSGFCSNLGICEEDEGCWRDSDCASGVCDYYTGECVSTVTNQTPTNPVPDPDPETNESKINFLAIILMILGMSAIGGGAFLYFKPETKPVNMKLPEKKPELKISKPKKLDYKESKKVQELRNKLSVDRSKKRKQVLSAFDSKTTTDKEVPQAARKKETQKNVEKKEKPKPENKKKPEQKKVPEVKTEYVDLTNKKKKDVFEELDDI